MRIRKRVYFAFIAVLCLVAAGCTPGTAGDANGQPTTDHSEARDDLVIGIEASPTTLLPNTEVNFVNDLHLKSIYEPLFNRDEEGKLHPYLATEWENIDDLTWRFKLREDVTFHDGEPFNAEAVKATVEYVTNEENKAGYLSYFVRIEEVNIINDYEFEIVTSEPFSNLIERLGDNLIMMPPHYLNEGKLDELASHPIGTGPYEFVEWSKDQHMELAAYDDYWQGEPAIKKVNFRVYPEFSSRLSAFLSGELDLFNNVPVDSIDEINSDDNSKVETVNTARIFFLAMNNVEGPLQDKKVRQAINHAVDVDELLGSVLNGFGEKMIGPLSKVNAGYTETKEYEYDPDKAVALLEEAGYDPNEMNLELETTSGRFPMDSHVAQAIASQLDRIGITVSVKVSEYNAYLNNIRSRQTPDMYLGSLGSQFEPSSTFDGLFMSTAQQGTFFDDELDEMIFEARQIVQPEPRKEAYDELQHWVVEEAAWVPLWQQGDGYAVNKNLDFKPRVDQRYMIQDMKWSQ